MFRQLPPLKALRAFEAAARHGSFTEAAKELSLTQGAISYQVRQLESKLEIDLFQRSARLVTLTGSGQSLYRTVHRLFRELEDEINSISPGREPLILTISFWLDCTDTLASSSFHSLPTSSGVVTTQPSPPK